MNGNPAAAAPARPVLLVRSGGEAALAEWRECFREFAAQVDVRWWDDPAVVAESVDYALVWQPEPGRLAGYPELKAVFSSGAGVDHILADPQLPAALPIVRMVTADTVQRMSEFAVMASLMLLKDMPRVIVQQRDRIWREFATPRTAVETRVGVMGLGALGQAAAAMLARTGFITAGWARSPRQLDGVACFAGNDALPAFLARTDILICLLPDTADTRGIVNGPLLAQLPRGASVINVGRGSHLDLAALTAALDAGHINNALLDVFAVEPLPPDAAVWTHPKIVVTPHGAATPSRRERARQVALAIAAMQNGEMPSHIYDRARGY